MLVQCKPSWWQRDAGGSSHGFSVLREPLITDHSRFSIGTGKLILSHSGPCSPSILEN